MWVQKSTQRLSALTERGGSSSRSKAVPRPSRAPDGMGSMPANPGIEPSAQPVVIPGRASQHLTPWPPHAGTDRPVHGTGLAGIPSKKTRLLEGDSQNFRRAARACEKKRGSPFGGGAVLGYPQRNSFPSESEPIGCHNWWPPPQNRP